jgi:glycosyltransferase involved in cell wall biosynthesis
MIISALLVTYNHERFVLDAIKSIFNQTKPADELIIADDGSTDKTVDIIEEYLKGANKQICNITRLYSPENRGIMENVQWAVDHSKGDMIAFFAGDDISHEQKLEICEKCFDEYPSASCVVGSYDIINTDGQIIGEMTYPNQYYQNFMETVRCGRVPFSPFGCVYHRRIWDIYGPMPKDLPNEDDQLMFRALICGGIAISSKKTALYRVSQGSASSWLRDNSNVVQFAKRFVLDQNTRRKHVRYWKILVRQSDSIHNQEPLLNALNKKEAFYEWLQDIENHSIFCRATALFRFISVLCLREMFICLLGFKGIMCWQKMKRIARRS